MEADVGGHFAKRRRPQRLALDVSARGDLPHAVEGDHLKDPTDPFKDTQQPRMSVSRSISRVHCTTV
jgi:hypothetical protein